MLRRLVCWEVAIFFAIWLLLMVAGRQKSFRDPGMFWHLTIGQQILQSGQLIREDTCSFTRQGSSWISQYWLYQCLMAGIHRVGGWSGLLLLTVTIVAATFTWIVARLRRSGLDAVCAVLLVALALVGSAGQFHMRPLIATIALMGLMFALLLDVESGRRRLRALWWLVPLFALWTNVHGGVLGGYGSLGLVVGGWSLAYVLGWDSPIRRRKHLAMLGALLVACTLALVANPYGLEVPKLWASILRMRLPDLIEEHAPAHLSGVSGVILFVLGAAYLVALAGVFPRRPRITWLLPLVWFALACARIRHGPLFAIVALLAVADFLPYSVWARLLARRDLFRHSPTASDDRSGRRFSMILLPVVLVATTFLLQATSVRLPVVGRDWVRLDASHWPVEMLPDLRKIGRDEGSNARVFNEMRYGGFLIYHTPHLRIFIDDRCELYGEPFLRDYVNAALREPDRIEAWADQYAFEHALVKTADPLDRYLQSAGRWEVVRRTETATLYRRSR